LINPSLSGYQKANATVSIVHSQTKNPEEITRQSDIVITAVGVANLVRGNWIKPCAAIIDVGINPVDVRNLTLFVMSCSFTIEGDLFDLYSCIFVYGSCMHESTVYLHVPAKDPRLMEVT
jgi:hypothetical protein